MLVFGRLQLSIARFVPLSRLRPAILKILTVLVGLKDQASIMTEVLLEVAGSAIRPVRMAVKAMLLVQVQIVRPQRVLVRMTIEQAVETMYMQKLVVLLTKALQRLLLRLLI